MTNRTTVSVAESPRARTYEVLAAPFLTEVRRLGGTEQGATDWLVEAIAIGLDADDDAKSLAWLCVDDELSNTEDSERAASLRQALGK